MIHTAVARSLWAISQRGVACLLFGLGAIVFALVPTFSLVLLFGAYALLDGTLALVAALRSESRTRLWPLAAEGLVGIGSGLTALLLPGLWTVALPRLVGGWAVATGALKALQAARLRRDLHGGWLLRLGGLGSVLVSLVLLLSPVQAPLSLALVWLIGAYALALGMVLLASSPG